MVDRHHADIKGQKRLEVILGGHVEWFVVQGRCDCSAFCNSLSLLWFLHRICRGYGDQQGADGQHAGHLSLNPSSTLSTAAIRSFLFLPENLRCSARDSA